MKNAYNLLFKLFTLYFLFGVIGSNSVFALSADFSLKSNILNETREMVVHLPEGYDKDHQDGYSVIYMLDAGNDDSPTAKVAKQLKTAGLIPKVIVVAIKNIRRGFDFSPPYVTFGRGDNKTIGNSRKFLGFIKTELIPETNRRFQVSGHKVFMGHSLGGGFSSYLLSQSPDLFDGFLIFSPALNNSRDRLFSDLSEKLNSDVKQPKFIYISVGGSEEEGFQQWYTDLTEVLKKHAAANVKLRFEVTKGATHMQNPRESISSALKFAWESTD